MSLKWDESRKGERSKGCLFSVIVDGILESTRLMGCNGTNSLHLEKAKGKIKRYIPQKLHPRVGKLLSA